MTEFDDFNPYSSPMDQTPGPPQDAPPVTTIPGWLICAFGLISMLIPLAFSGSANLSELANDAMFPLMFDALIYGLPAAITTLVFGARNVRRGIDPAVSILGCLFAIAAIVIALGIAVSMFR